YTFQGRQQRRDHREPKRPLLHPASFDFRDPAIPRSGQRRLPHRRAAPERFVHLRRDAIPPHPAGKGRPAPFPHLDRLSAFAPRRARPDELMKKDTPEVLRVYADKLRKEPIRWDFLTGPLDAIASLSRDGFKLGLSEGEQPESGPIHSTRFVLVDRRGSIRGYYDALAPDGVTKL